MPQHQLGPHLIGERIVVRARTRDGAATDVLGELLRWDDLVEIRRGDGSVAQLDPRSVITGKSVPPRASVRQRLSADEVERRTALGWRATEEVALGDWLLRAAGGYSRRANSALVGGDPGVPIEEAAARVRSFYRDLGLPPLAQVVVGSAEADALSRLGWVPSRPEEADVCVQVASVSQLWRELRQVDARDVVLADHPDERWLAAFPRERAHGQVAVDVLRGAEDVAFARRDDLAWARGALARDWVGITSVLVAPEGRRQGHATALLAAIVGWAAEHGASTAYVQVLEDNQAARGGYEKLGFRTHHRYRYLTPG